MVKNFLILITILNKIIMCNNKKCDSFFEKAFQFLGLWIVVLNVILLCFVLYDGQDLLNFLLGVILLVEMISLFIFVFWVISNYTTELFIEEDPLREFIKKELQSNNDTLKNEFLEKIKHEEQNVVFLRTLSDAICKNSEWDVESIEKLLKAISSIVKKKNDAHSN